MRKYARRLASVTEPVVEPADPASPCDSQAQPILPILDVWYEFVAVIEIGRSQLLKFFSLQNACISMLRTVKSRSAQAEHGCAGGAVCQ